MKQIEFETSFKTILADVFTPVAIYLRLRDRFRDTILLESTDHHAAENSFSYICINAIAGIEVTSLSTVEYKLPGQKPERISVRDAVEIPDHVNAFMHRFNPLPAANSVAAMAQGLYGYTSYDAVSLFETIRLDPKPEDHQPIPLVRYRLYQYVIAIDHFRDELTLCENKFASFDGDVSLIESLIRSKDVPVYPFKAKDHEQSNLTDEQYREMVRKGIAGCMRGDVFQVVLSRRFRQQFNGDEFNVYRALRSVNPSPYLFFFDYGDYRLFGSSPESQLIVHNGKAIVHPIAGTCRRTGDEAVDKHATRLLLDDAKENAEHVMLVDLARNDLSRVCDEVHVSQYKSVQYFSHVIHLVSEVTGNVKAGEQIFNLIGKTFPAGTLSGAPKYRAMQLINEYEPTSREYYGGAIGFMGFNGTCNHAIMIRTFLSRMNVLTCQAGAGVVAASKPDTELEEVNNKLGALKRAIQLAEKISN